MRLIRLFIVLAGFSITACTADDSAVSWRGEYKHFSSAGETAGGSQIMMSELLKIEKKWLKESCEFEMSGFQTYRTLLCSIEPSNNKLKVKFKSYEDGSLVNINNVAEYQVGEVLFTLEKPPALDKSNHYPLQWGAYTPFGIKTTKTDEYFEKVR